MKLKKYNEYNSHKDTLIVSAFPGCGKSHYFRGNKDKIVLDSDSSIKSYLRDINLEILTNCPDVKVDVSKRYSNRFRIFYPSRKLIKYVTKIGGVLTGSRAIRCYTISGKPILERKVKDWDFVVTLDMAFKICDEMGIDQIPQLDDTISIQNQRMWRHPDYSDSYRVGPVDVQLIVREELPDFIEVRGVRISHFGYSLSQKIELTSDLQHRISKKGNSVPYEIGEQYSKHMTDLREMIIKFNSLKWNQPNGQKN